MFLFLVAALKLLYCCRGRSSMRRHFVIPLERGEVSGCRRTTLFGCALTGIFQFRGQIFILVGLVLLTSDTILVSDLLTDSVRILY